MRAPHHPPDLKWILRGTWAVAGLLWFLWIGYEDRSTATVLLVSGLLSFALALTGFARRTRGGSLEARGWLIRSGLAGLLGGGLVGPMAALLMMLKASLHLHPQPDFTAAELINMLEGTPGWAVAGLTIGLGLGAISMDRPGEIR